MRVGYTATPAIPPFEAIAPFPQFPQLEEMPLLPLSEVIPPFLRTAPTTRHRTGTQQHHQEPAPTRPPAQRPGSVSLHRNAPPINRLRHSAPRPAGSGFKSRGVHQTPIK
ncbi:MAG: hypothetical protein QOD05_2347 [Microbacteriaceae bacterium]|nr:hypothetical protein [Microbacteriaceae bacterium]